MTKIKKGIIKAPIWEYAGILVNSKEIPTFKILFLLGGAGGSAPSNEQELFGSDMYISELMNVHMHSLSPVHMTCTLVGWTQGALQVVHAFAKYFAV